MIERQVIIFEGKNNASMTWKDHHFYISLNNILFGVKS